MARLSASSSSSLYSLLLISSLLLASHIHASSEALSRPPIVKGLDWNYYWLKCPRLERIVRKHLEDVFEKDKGQAPGLLRILFHDCFPQGCDASLLLDGFPEDEKNQTANAGLRPEALQTIENLRSLVHRQCGRVVSCADITVLAAREAVKQLGGPDFDVPLGRKDSLTFDINAPNATLPAPFFRTSKLLADFGAQNFDATDVVALSGAHTYGRAHCVSLFNRTTDPEPPIDQEFKNKLEATCPSNAPIETTVDLDVRTPTVFDNMYYINLLNRQGVFTSDQDIASDPRTREIVNSFASNQKLFFDKFADAFVKLSQLRVLTGKQGEIRKKCSATNGKKSFMKSVVEEVVELAGKI